jgi:predicted metal-dependent hydrolase
MNSLKTKQYTVEIQREWRKSIKLTVNSPTSIKIIAPRIVSKKRIYDFIDRKESWIDKQIEEIKETAAYLNFKSHHPSFLYYLGEKYPTRIGPYKTIQFENNILLLPKDYTEDSIVKWYKERAKEIIQDRVTTYCDDMNLTYNQIRIKTLRSRWGSCSAKKNLNFNWKLILFDIEKLNYVVIHEVSHLKHLNHSKQFWETVKDIQPGFNVHHHFLQNHSHILRSYGID